MHLAWSSLWPLLPASLLGTALIATSVIGAAVTAQTSTAPASKRPTGSKSSTASSTASHHAAVKKPAAPPPLMTDDQKTIYALGLVMYRSLGQFSLSPAEMEIMKRALNDAAAGKPEEDLQAWGPKIEAFRLARATQAAERQKTASQEYLAKAGAEPGATKTESGLIYRELTPGTGASPKPTDTVKVNYRGTLIDGTEFDSSYKRNEPAQFPLNGVIPCWTEGLQKMKVGGKARLICPSSIAYGEQGRPSIPGNAALIFEVELVDIVTAAPQPQPAPQVPQPPPTPRLH